MENTNIKFVTAIPCKDRRAIEPVFTWVRENMGQDNVVDMDTIPGADGVLAKGDFETMSALHDKIEISLDKHGADTILLAGHHDCAANPVSKEQHLADVRAGVAKIKAHAFSKPVTVIGLFVNENWAVEKVDA